MKEYWQRFENWLKINAPHLLPKLNPGATQEDIERLEDCIGMTLPADFVEFYKIHNGQVEGSEGFIDSEELMDIDDIIGGSNFWKGLLDSRTFEDDGRQFTSDPDDGVKNNWWNPLWVPFTHDYSGDHICLDLDPTPYGNFGQVIQMRHDSGYRDLYASTFTKWFENYVTGLENGKYVYAKDWGLVDKDSPFNKP